MGIYVRKSNLMRVIIVLDESGSMHHVTNDTIGGVNSYLDSLRKDEEAAYNVTIVKFNTAYNFICRNQPISKVPKITHKNYSPGGMTALYDAVGRSILEVEKELIPGEKVLVVITTDGQENSSCEYPQSTIKRMIEEKQDSNYWTFVFLGADMSAWDAGCAMGIYGTNTIRYAVSDTVGTWNSISNSTIKYSRSALCSTKNFKEDFYDENDA